MSTAFQSLAKQAYAPPAANPYQQMTPTPTMGAAEWGSAPGLKAQPKMGWGEKAWRSKGEITGGLGGWSAGAAAGAAIGAPFGGVGAIPGAVIGGVVGGLAGSELGAWGGGKADDAMNAQADKGKLYRPPVTDMASYGANMISQGIQENRDRAAAASTAT